MVWAYLEVENAAILELIVFAGLRLKVFGAMIKRIGSLQPIGVAGMRKHSTRDRNQL
jgi:hypothetical protein